MPAKRKRAQEQQNANKFVAPLLPPEVDEEEIHVSDEDVEFITKNKRYAGVMAGLDTKGITKHVLGLRPDWKGDNLERFYEKKVQTAAAKQQSTPGPLNVDPVDVLPVKTFDGKLEFKRPSKESPVNTATTDEKPEAKPNPTRKKRDKALKALRTAKQDKAKQQSKSEDAKGTQDEEVVMETKATDDLQSFVSKEERRSEMKLKIAELCTELLSNPEASLNPLKDLLGFCSDGDDALAHLAMLSLVAIFKDLIPGYRIRPPTEKELEMQVSKDVKKLRDYESSLLRNYQAFVQKLSKVLKRPSSQHVAVKCVCGLLEAMPHFNYRDTLLATIIPYTNSTDERCRTLACQALTSIFKHETKHNGEATVEAVELVADFVKENHCCLHPDVLRPFLCLTFDEDLHKADHSKHGKGGKNMANKKFKSKKEEKRAKRKALTERVRTEVEDDFREAANAPDIEQRSRQQSQTLAAVFETYFRVLKTALAERPGNAGESKAHHPLLLVSLEGLLKFSHLISVEFMGDLITVLRKLAEAREQQAEGGDSIFSVEERVQCCTAAFRIMKMNMDALTVDLRDFYVHFYNMLLDIAPDRDQASENNFASSLQVILCDNRQQDMQRVAAFIKRLAAISLHLGTGTATAALATVRLMLSRYKQCRNLLDNEEGVTGVGSDTVFQPDGTDPDLSGALSSVLWELSLLEKHYNPEVARFAKQVANMASSETPVHSAMTPSTAVTMFSAHSGGFRPAVKPPANVTRKDSYRKSLAAEAEDVQQQGLAEANFCPYFKLLRDIKDNHRLRKELARSEVMLKMYEDYRPTKKKRRQCLRER